MSRNSWENLSPCPLEPTPTQSFCGYFRVSISVQKKNGCFVLFSVCLYICVCECLLHDNITGVPSRFAQYCASTCVRFGCTRHAISICVDCKPKKNQHDSRSNMARYLRLFQITFFLSDYLVNRVEKKIARIFQKKIVVMDAFVVWNPQTHP